MTQMRTKAAKASKHVLVVGALQRCNTTRGARRELNYLTHSTRKRSCALACTRQVSLLASMDGATALMYHRSVRPVHTCRPLESMYVLVTLLPVVIVVPLVSERDTCMYMANTCVTSNDIEPIHQEHYIFGSRDGIGSP